MNYFLNDILKTKGHATYMKNIYLRICSFRERKSEAVYREQIRIGRRTGSVTGNFKVLPTGGATEGCYSVKEE